MFMTDQFISSDRENSFSNIPFVHLPSIHTSDEPLVNCVRRPKMPTKFIDLPEEILVGICFTGYLGFDWYEVKEYALINRLLFRLAQTTAAKIEIHDSLYSKTAQNLSSIMKNIHFLDFSECMMEYLPSIHTTIAKWSHSLKSLIFRGTNIVDEDINYIMNNISSSYNPLKPLKLFSIDLSKAKSADRPQISDRAMEYFTSSPAFQGSELLWLNLSMTNISDHSLELIVSHFPKLQLLGIQCCPRVTDAGLALLSQLPLTFLDITGCKGLTVHSVEALFSQRSNSPLAASLLIFACAHLSSFSYSHLSLIIENSASLRRLDCRSSNLRGEEAENPRNIRIVEKARNKLEYLVYRHEDLLKVPMDKAINIIAMHPNYFDHWEHFRWPYYRPMARKLVHA